MQDHLIIFDTTLRDGEQSPGASMTREEKMRIARQLERLRADVIEAGFPASSNGDFEAVRAIARTLKDSTVCALARANENDIRRAGEALKGARSGRLHTFIASSPIHMQMKLRMTPEQVLEQAIKAVRWAREYTDDVEFSPEDAGRSEPDFLCRLLEATIKAGATTVNIPDTVGYTTPEEYAATFRMLIEKVPGAENVIFSTHCHDDLGMAVANTLAGIQAGARQVECTITGIGERAGNAALEEIAAALMVRRDKLPYTNNIKMEKLFPTSKILAEFISFGVSPNKAIVGANAFAHESGIHQHGVMANPLTYEIMTPESVGVPANNMVLGKHSGRRMLEQRLAELGHPLTRSQLDDVYHRFTELADRKKNIYDQDLLGLLHHDKSTVVTH